MAASDAAIGALRWSPRRLHALRDRPALLAEAGIAAAWLALVLSPAHGGIAHRHGSHHHVHALAGGSSSLVATLPLWALMTAAMMLPAALPAVRHVALNSFRWRRPRATLEFTAVYLAVWIAAGAALLALARTWAPVSDQLVLALVLATAAAWQLTTAKRRALNACHLPSTLPPRGWRATAGVARFGLRNGGACVGSCWATMLVMAVAPSAHLPWMAALTGLVASEKLSRHPRRATARGAALLGAAAVAAGVLAVAAPG